MSKKGNHDEESAVVENVNPANGEIVDFDDADSLIDNLSQIKQTISALYQFSDRIQSRLLSMAEFEEGSATSRIAGDRRVVKISKASPVWDMERLAAFRTEFPTYGKKLLTEKPSYSVNQAELKKLLSSVGKVASKAKLFIQSCRIPSNSKPSFTIEQ